MASWIMNALTGRNDSSAAPPMRQPAPLEQFRARHFCEDPILAWRRADKLSRPSQAFNLVALDPGLLDQVDTLTGLAMARSARDIAAGLIGSDADPETSPVAAAARFAAAAARDWIAGNRLFRPQIELTVGRAAPPATDILQAALTSARHTFPQYEEQTAAICLLAVMELGLDGLAQIGAPELLTVGASRFAAWSVGCRLRTADPADEAEAASALSTVQAWASGAELPVLHVPYTGRKASAAQQALSLARDALACAHLVRDRPDLIPRRGAELWEQAAERHAYAGVALQESSLMDLDSDTAVQLGDLAWRFASIAGGADPPAMPIFPAGAPVAEPRTIQAGLRWLRH